MCPLIGKYFLNAECKIVLVNKFTVSTFFNYKDKLPAGVRSTLVYKFSCAQCASTYTGSTGRIIIIIIKKDWQSKAGRGRLPTYQSEDPSPTLPTYRGKEEKGKIVEDKKVESN